MKSYTVPDIIWPSSNDYGIPDLLPDFQPQAVSEPFERWGDKGRTTRHKGTIHFYTEDYKFENVWRYPLSPLQTGVQALVEPNFSTGNGQPLAVSLWDIYRKRWLARFWQSCQAPVWVDLNVDLAPEHALLGVPHGWRAYCTRGLDGDYKDILSDYEVAAAHCGDEPLFLVYGGGTLIENICYDKGWLWQPENMRVKDGTYTRRIGLQLRTTGVYYG